VTIFLELGTGVTISSHCHIIFLGSACNNLQNRVSKPGQVLGSGFQVFQFRLGTTLKCQKIVRGHGELLLSALLSVVKCIIVILVQFFLSVHGGWLVSFPSQFGYGRRQRIHSRRCTRSDTAEACVVSIIVFPRHFPLFLFNTMAFWGVTLFRPHLLCSCSLDVDDASAVNIRAPGIK